MDIGKTVIVVIFILIVLSLASAFRFMMQGGGKSGRTANALTLRIGLSLALFGLLFVLYALGVIEPHGIRP